MYVESLDIKIFINKIIYYHTQMYRFAYQRNVDALTTKSPWSLHEAVTLLFPNA